MQEDSRESVERDILGVAVRQMFFVECIVELVKVAELVETDGFCGTGSTLDHDA
jgi:hypothetical protein